METIRVRSLFSKFFFELSTFKGRQFYRMSRHQGGKFKKTQVITIPPNEVDDFKNFLKLILVELQVASTTAKQDQGVLNEEIVDQDERADEEIVDDEEIIEDV